MFADGGNSTFLHEGVRVPFTTGEVVLLQLLVDHDWKNWVQGNNRKTPNSAGKSLLPNSGQPFPENNPTDRGYN